MRTTYMDRISHIEVILSQLDIDETSSNHSLSLQQISNILSEPLSLQPTLPLSLLSQLDSNTVLIKDL